MSAWKPRLPWTTALGLLEGLAMSLILPRWQNDVKTLGAAWRLREQMLQEPLR